MLLSYRTKAVPVLADRQLLGGSLTSGLGELDALLKASANAWAGLGKSCFDLPRLSRRGRATMQMPSWVGKYKEEGKGGGWKGNQPMQLFILF